MSDNRMQLGCRVDRGLVERFKQDVRERKGKVRGEFGKEVERALEAYLEAPKGETQNQKLDRIEEKQDEILSRLGESPSSSENRTTHTQTEAESDGGVSVQETHSDDPAKITSFDEYEPDLPGDYELSRDTLEDCIGYIESGGAINEDHVDTSLLTSRGFAVKYKVAICAGIIRYEEKDIASEDTIRSALSELLGSRRQANAKFDSVVAYFYDSIGDHDEINHLDVDYDELDGLIYAVTRPNLYAVSYEVLDGAYQNSSLSE